ncbi:hypothetical protein ACRRTK_019340 [Alexandromys fortis]
MVLKLVESARKMTRSLPWTQEISISQRRVTFHLPDGSQESCSDSGLGDHEPVGSGTLISHPLPLVQPQDEFYDQASPDKRTEADGNSDPNSVSLEVEGNHSPGKLQVWASAAVFITSCES